MSINKLRKPRSEDEIKHFWTYTDKVYISCVCITYNQEIYIKDAIDSMLAQQTEYRFEIIIHDDFSSDKTREIIYEYKKKYPTIIKLVLQEENKYSKNPRIIPLIIPYIEGHYVTICEGDDFWIDSCKLEKQIIALESNTQVNICFTAAKSLSADGIINVISNFGLVSEVYTLNKVISGGGEFMPTASIMLRAEIIYNLPSWYYTAPVGDYFLQIFSSMYNGALYLPEITSVYRTNSTGSWSSQRKSMTIKQIELEGKRYEETFNKLIEDKIPASVINREIANQYMHLSMLAINSNYKKTAKKMICKSWTKQKRIGRRQIIIYAMRNLIPILKIGIFLNKKIKNIFFI